MSYPYLIQGNNVVVVVDNKPHTISRSHLNYALVINAIKNNDWETVKQIVDPVEAIVHYSKGNIEVQNRKLFWKGVEFNGTLANRMIQMLTDGFDIEPLANFMENLMQNPSKRAVDELYGFLEASELPITPDGHFLAYKKVRSDFLDIHSGTMDNSPGKIVEMERNQVDDNKEVTCSTGLHFCAREYLDHFGRYDSRIVIVKINPRDVVSIPVDYNNAKGRACRYEVISELKVEPEAAFDRPVQSNANRPVKTGDSLFYLGYHHGYTGSDYRPMQLSGKDHTDYSDGYRKGRVDAQAKSQPRYVFVGEDRIEQDLAVEKEAVYSGTWPYPTNH